jgi:hypothetical protein
VGDDGRVTPVMKVKLSISGEAIEMGVSQVRPNKSINESNINFQ